MTNSLLEVLQKAADVASKATFPTTVELHPYGFLVHARVTHNDEFYQIRRVVTWKELDLLQPSALQMQIDLCQMALEHAISPVPREIVSREIPPC
jgi:hypothetical protein